MVTAIWGAAVAVIITDGVEAEGIITAGGIIATDFNLKEAAAVGGLFHVMSALASARNCHITLNFLTRKVRQHCYIAWRKEKRIGVAFGWFANEARRAC
jgi:hypothetical protein